MAAGFAPPEEPIPVEVAGRSVGGIEIRLRRATVSLSGRLLGLTAEETRAATVEARSLASTSASARGRGDGQGGYRLQGLYPGRWLVSARLAPDREAQGQIVLDPAASEATLDLTFSRLVALSGRILVDGAPQPGVKVELQGPRSPGTTTDEEGRFALEKLPPGSYLLLATLGGDAPRIRQLQLEADQEISLELETGALHGRVTAAGTGEPLAGCLAALESLEGGMAVTGPHGQTGETGEYAFPRLPTGRYQLSVDCAGRGRQQRAVVVRAGPETLADVALGPDQP